MLSSLMPDWWEYPMPILYRHGGRLSFIGQESVAIPSTDPLDTLRMLRAWSVCVRRPRGRRGTGRCWTVPGSFLFRSRTDRMLLPLTGASFLSAGTDHIAALHFSVPALLSFSVPATPSSSLPDTMHIHPVSRQVSAAVPDRSSRHFLMIHFSYAFPPSRIRFLC